MCKNVITSLHPSICHFNFTTNEFFLFDILWVCVGKHLSLVIILATSLGGLGITVSILCMRDVDAQRQV